jgi:hypothetical protein
MDEEPLYREAFQSTLDAINAWDRKHPTEDRDPGELLESEDFHNFLYGINERPKTSPIGDKSDDFGAGILDH